MGEDSEDMESGFCWQADRRRNGSPSVQRKDMSSRGQQPGRSWIPAGARPAGRADPVDAAGDLCRPGAPDGAGGRGGDQG
eukprot:10980379-Alexandrium_andersonii.AAC.1